VEASQVSFAAANLMEAIVMLAPKEAFLVALVLKVLLNSSPAQV